VTVRVSMQFGVVIRRAALDERGIDRQAVLAAMEAKRPLGESPDLITFGPHFGQEALDEFMRRLEALGLEHVTDFFETVMDVPDWLELSALLKG
jgi:hypothetical protein